MTDNAIDKIKKAERAVEKIRRERAELDGRRKQLMERLLDDFEIKTVAEAETLLEKLRVKEADLSNDLGSALEELDVLMEQFNV